MRSPLRPAAALAAALAILVLLPAVAGAGQPATPPGEPIAHPTGADEVILRIDELPGFVPVEYVLKAMPSFTLYGDGRAIVQGPITLIYPGPALPNLRQLTLTEEGIQAVLAEARAAGVLGGDRELRNDMVTDLSTTRFIANAGGRTSTVAVYGLGVAEENLPAEEQAARRTLLEFQGRLLDLAGWLPAGAIAEGDTAYEIERVQVVSLPAAPGAATPAPDQDVARGIFDWPLAESLATAGEPATALRFPLEGARCFVVEGAEAEQVVTALEGANELALWRSGGELFEVYPRPLLPDESGCGVDAEAAGSPEAAATPGA
jgi:hypothetical protein